LRTTAGRPTFFSFKARRRKSTTQLKILFFSDFWAKLGETPNKKKDPDGNDDAGQSLKSRGVKIPPLKSSANAPGSDIPN
jgi:hypothetical protein